jgi:hypothetical protein
MTRAASHGYSNPHTPSLFASIGALFRILQDTTSPTCMTGGWIYGRRTEWIG